MDFSNLKGVEIFSSKFGWEIHSHKVKVGDSLENFGGIEH